MVVDDRVSTSMELYDRAGRLIPGRTQLLSRRASMFAEGVSPVYADRAKGSRFIDVDGNEYIDWVNCVSAVILGHADPVVDGAVKEQIDRGSRILLTGGVVPASGERNKSPVTSLQVPRSCVRPIAGGCTMLSEQPLAKANGARKGQRALWR